MPGYHLPNIGWPLRATDTFFERERMVGEPCYYQNK